jgi:hypothetical protein
MSDLADPAKPKTRATPALPVTPEPSALINALLTSQDHPPNALELVGFPGPIDECGNVRLYPTLDLRACYQFSAKSILYAEPADPNDPTKPTKIVVDGTTKLEIVLSIESAFLEGAITAAHKLGDVKRIATSLLKLADNPLCHVG